MSVDIESLPLAWIPIHMAAETLRMDLRTLLELGIQHAIEIFALLPAGRGCVYSVFEKESNSASTIQWLGMDYYRLSEHPLSCLIHDSECYEKQFFIDADDARCVFESPVRLTTNHLYVHSAALDQIRGWRLEYDSLGRSSVPSVVSASSPEMPIPKENEKQLNALRRLVGVLCYVLADKKDLQEYWEAGHPAPEIQRIAQDVLDQVSELKLKPVGLGEENVRKMLRSAMQELEATPRVQPVDESA